MWIDPARKEVLEEQNTQRCHGEGFDQPVDHQREHQALRLFAHVLDRMPVDLDHHRINHDPDEYGHHQVHLCDFHRGHGLEDAGHDQPETNTSQNAQPDPDGQVTLKNTHRSDLFKGVARQVQQTLNTDRFVFHQRDQRIPLCVLRGDGFDFTKLVAGTLP